MIMRVLTIWCEVATLYRTSVAREDLHCISRRHCIVCQMRFEKFHQIKIQTLPKPDSAVIRTSKQNAAFGVPFEPL